MTCPTADALLNPGGPCEKCESFHSLSNRGPSWKYIGDCDAISDIIISTKSYGPKPYGAKCAFFSERHQ